MSREQEIKKAEACKRFLEQSLENAIKGQCKTKGIATLQVALVELIELIDLLKK